MAKIIEDKRFKKNIINNKSKKSIKKKKIKKEKDVVLFASIIILVLVGLVMVFSASSYYALYEKGDVYYFLKNQILWVIVGLGAMYLFTKVDYHFLRKCTGLLAIGTFILLILVLIIGVELNGAKRWIHIGPLSLQPSELAKYAVVFFLASSLDINRIKIRKFFGGSLNYFIFAGAFALLVLLEKNLSITAVIMIVAYIMLYIGGANKKHLLNLIPVGFLCGIFLIVIEPYRLTRLTTFMNPWNDPSQSGYQLIHSLLAIGSGGLTGQGLGGSMQKALYMPEPHNDFIFAIITEELGLIGAVFIIAVFIVLILTALSIAVRAKDNYGRLLATGITCVIAVQAIINIAVVTGSMPVTGVPLPFISYGGTSLVINLTAMGVLLNISKQAKVN